MTTTNASFVWTINHKSFYPASINSVKNASILGMYNKKPAHCAELMYQPKTTHGCLQKNYRPTNTPQRNKMERKTIKDNKGYTLDLIEHNGIHYPGYTINLDNIRDLPMRDDDVILLAHPSSGTHWLFEIATQLLRGKAESVKNVKQELYIEMAAFDQMEQYPSPRVLNTHIVPQLFSLKQLENRNLIFVTRNPKDAIVSLYNHVYNAPGFFNYDGEFEDFYDLMATYEVHHSWWEYTQTWEDYFTAHPQLNVIYLYYEDLKEDLESGVRKLADHLGVDTTDRPTLIADITKLCTFDKMKADKRASFPAELKGVYRDGSTMVYRKGTVGDWKNYFTVAMNERFDQQYRANTGRSKIAGKVRFT